MLYYGDQIKEILNGDYVYKFIGCMRNAQKRRSVYSLFVWVKHCLYEPNFVQRVFSVYGLTPTFQRE